MKGSPRQISVIVSTYNWPQALQAVLASLARQTDRFFEVIVADDGSTPETGDLVNKLALDFPVPLTHVWQEDRGFRAAASRNRAVASSSGGYLLFLDGDCLVRPNYIERHRLLAEPGRFVAGNRILLDAELTAEVLSSQLDPSAWDINDFIRARSRGRINRLLPLLYLPGNFWRCWRPRRWQGAMTCNLAVRREDFYQVNGFDENFVGWGHEDAEFVGRLINAGIYRKEGRFAAPVLHLWHRSQDRAGEADNLRRLHEHLAARLIRAEAGVDRYENCELAGKGKDDAVR